jgi:hypothetical protein
MDMCIVIACYIRTVALRPAINRFISGQRIFARRNIQVSMAIKRGLSTDASETTIKVDFEPTDTIFDVYRKMNEQIDEIKADTGDNNTEKVAAFLFKLPGILLKFAIWLIRLADYLIGPATSGRRPSRLHVQHGSGSLGFACLSLCITWETSHLLAFVQNKAMSWISTGALRRKYINYTCLRRGICYGSYYATFKASEVFSTTRSFWSCRRESGRGCIRLSRRQFQSNGFFSTKPFFSRPKNSSK